MASEFDFCEPSPNWEYYLPRAIEIARANNLSHVIVVLAWEEDHGGPSWFHFADDFFGTYDENSGVIEKRCGGGGGSVVHVEEIGYSPQG